MKKLFLFSVLIASSLLFVSKGISQNNGILQNSSSFETSSNEIEQSKYQVEITDTLLIRQSNSVLLNRNNKQEFQSSKKYQNANLPQGIDNSTPLQPLIMEPKLVNSKTDINNKVGKEIINDKIDGSKDWTIIHYEDFEGSFPSGLWDRGTLSGVADATWDDWQCWYHSSNESAGCADKGSDGISCGENYPNNMDAWMRYGPFDLSDPSISDADFSFYFTLECENNINYDYFSVGASINGTNFYGTPKYAGNYTNEFVDFDLTNVPQIGNLLGEPQVWIIFWFHSDGSINMANGAQVDDVTIWKNVSSGTQNLELTGGSFSPNPVSEDGTLYIDAQITNNGNGAASSSEIQYYLSTNTNITPSDCYLGNDYVTLNPGQTGNETITVDLSGIGCVNTGTYYVGVYFVDESDGWYWTAPLVITTSGIPDINVTPTSLTINEPSKSSVQGYDKTVSLNEKLTGEYIENELLIRFKEEIKSNMISDIIISSGCKILKYYNIITNLYLVEISDGIDVPTKAAFFESFNEILYAEPNHIVYVVQTIPNDQGFGGLYGMHNTGQNGGTFDADIDAPEAWDISTGNSTVVVGIIDSGLDYDHPDLLSNIWTNPGEIANNGVDDDNNGYVDDIHGWDWAYNDNDPSDFDGHGTHVAGTVGAVGNNTIGVSGVCWTVKLMALKFLNDQGSGNTSNAISAIEYAANNGATLTNNSWGGGGYSSSLRTAILNSNMIFAAAAGNGGPDYIGDDNDVTPHYPSSYDCNNIIAVASLDRNNIRATSSNFGATSVDLGAYGVSILSTKPNNATAINFGTPGQGLSSNFYGIISGTSMATPQVAGLAALIYSNNSSLSWTDVKNTIMNNVEPVPALSGITVTGGCINAYNSLNSSGSQNSFTIQNVGTAVLSITSIYDNKIWLSTSGYPGSTFNISPGNSQNVSVGIDWGLLGGTQQTGIITVTSNDPDEPSVTVSVTAIPEQLPDLIVQNQSINPSTVFAGETISSSCTVKNQGNGSASNSRIRYYLSTNQTWGTSDIELGDDYVTSLSPGSTSPENENLIIPAGTQADTYYILFFADADLEVNESDEDNNVSYSQLIIATPSITLNPTYANVSASVGNTTVSVSSNVNWTVSESCSWVTCSPTGGTNNGSFTVNYDENFSIDPRSCTITVAGDGASAIYTLNQEGADPYIILNPTYDDVDASAGSTTVSVTSNVSWTVSENCDWLYCSPTSGNNNDSFNVIYEENTGTGARTCTINVSGNGVSTTYILTQDYHTSISNNTSNNNIKIYPNPTLDILTIEIDKIIDNRYRMHLFDLLGNIIMDEELTSNDNKIVKQLNISNLSSGVYMLQITDTYGSVIKYERIVKK